MTYSVDILTHSESNRANLYVHICIKRYSNKKKTRRLASKQCWSENATHLPLVWRRERRFEIIAIWRGFGTWLTRSWGQRGTELVVSVRGWWRGRHCWSSSRVSCHQPSTNATRAGFQRMRRTQGPTFRTAQSSPRAVSDAFVDTAVFVTSRSVGFPLDFSDGIDFVLVCCTCYRWKFATN